MAYMVRNIQGKYSISEDTLQIQCVRYFDCLHLNNAFLHHSPNGGARNPIEGAKFKRMGVRAGYPDLTLLFNGKTVFIELKREKGYLSTPQKNFRDWALKNGFEWHLIRTFDEFINLLQELKLVKHAYIRPERYRVGEVLVNDGVGFSNAHPAFVGDKNAIQRQSKNDN
jgi:hypothetical protein